MAMFFLTRPLLWHGVGGTKSLSSIVEMVLDFVVALGPVYHWFRLFRRTWCEHQGDTETSLCFMAHSSAFQTV